MGDEFKEAMSAVRATAPSGVAPLLDALLEGDEQDLDSAWDRLIEEALHEA